MIVNVLKKVESADIFENIADLGAHLATMAAPHSKLFVLADENTMAHCMPMLVAACPALNEAHMLEIDPGDDNKCLEIAGQLWSCLLETKADRQSLIINLGGGVITDLGGFVASAYKRGISYINVPTTLMAQTDAAIGGKTGINHEGVKNAVGTFYPAKATLICPAFLETLDDEELLSGLAEMLKHGLIADKNLWDELAVIHLSDLSLRADLIRQSIAVKTHITTEDPHEKGLRKLLNAGHTMGHALEAHAMTLRTPMSHGRAVAMGLCFESALALSKGLLTNDENDEIQSVISGFFGRHDFSGLSPEDLLAFVRNDKKNQFDKILFALPTGIGMAVFDIEIAEEEIENCLLSLKR